MSYEFNHKPYGSTVGSGSYIFRHYGDEGETWLLNSYPSTFANYSFTNLSFISNENSYTGLFESYVAGEPPSIIIKYDNTNVYVNTSGGWVDTAYRTVTFSEPPTGDLLTWLEANAVKQ